MTKLRTRTFAPTGGGQSCRGNLKRRSGRLVVRFVVTDAATGFDIACAHNLADLLSESKVVAAHAKLGEDGLFTASETKVMGENTVPLEGKLTSIRREIARRVRR